MFGVRVFEVGVSEGARGRLRLDLANPLKDGRSLIDRTQLSAVHLIGQGLRTGVPQLHRAHEWVSPEATRGEPQILFSDVQVTPQGHLFMRVRHGLYGDYDSALGDEGEVDLRNRVAVRDYRALLLTPASGMEGRLVVETIGRRCPVTMLVRWLGFAGFTEDPRSWVRMKVEQIADRERVREMIRNAEKVTAELTQKQVGAPGRRPVVRKLTTSVTSEIARENAVEEALSWLTPDEDRHPRDYVLRIETISGFDPEELDSVGLHFNSGAIVVEDDQKKEKRLDPESIRDKFTYSVSQDVQLDDVAWIDHVRRLLRGTLSEGTDIQV